MPNSTDTNNTQASPGTHIDEQSHSGEATQQTLARTFLSSAPLSFAQRQYWHLQRLTPNRAACNECFMLSMPGRLNVYELEESLHLFILRHEIWRTSFHEVNGQLIQTSQPDLLVPVTEIDLRHLPARWRENTAHRLATEDALHPFDLGRCPLFRILLMHFSDTDHRLFFTLHQLIFDRYAMYHVLLPELWAIYQARVSGMVAQLPTLPMQYADFANEQQRMAQRDELIGHLDYWREQLANAPPLLPLPTDYPRLPVRSYRGRLHAFMIPSQLTSALKALSQREGVTLYMTLLAAFQALLYRYSGQDDMVLGTTTTGRKRAETRLLMGAFRNMLALRCDLSGNPPFRTLLHRVRAAIIAAQEHDELPFELLVQALCPEEPQGYMPLVQVVLSLEEPHQRLPSGWQVMPVNVDMGTASFDLLLELDEQADGLMGRFIYRTDLFHEATIARMVGHWQTLLESIVIQPVQRLSELALLTRAELFQALVEWNRTRMPYPPMLTIQHLFETQAGRDPEAPALRWGEELLSYRALNGWANQIAHRLQHLGVGPEVPVGLYLEPSPEMVVGLLGIFKAGGVCVPMNPAYPPERLTFMLDDAQIEVLVSRQALLKRLPALASKTVCFDSDGKILAAQRVENPVIKAHASSPAFIVYSFGSPPAPYGLQVSQRAVVNALLSLHERPGLGASDSLLLASSRSYEMTALECLLPLTVGARLVLSCPEVAKNEQELTALLISEGVTIMLALPETWQSLLESGWSGRRLKALCHCEVLPDDLIAQLLPRVFTLWHLYSPADTLTWITLWKVDSEFESRIIGYPVANTQVYVLDAHQTLVPIGVPGELWLGGVGLARGYLNRPELTNARFVPHPWNSAPEARLFRTGILVRYRPDGSLDWLGRCELPIVAEGSDDAVTVRMKKLPMPHVVEGEQVKQEERKEKDEQEKSKDAPCGRPVEAVEDACEKPELVKVQIGTNKPAFFFLRGIDHSGYTYCIALAHGLGENQPFYALSPLPLHQRTSPPTLETIAAAYVATIRQAQEQGPYLLGGFGDGALVAYEAARQLQAADAQIDLLALVDPHNFSIHTRLRRVIQHVGTLLRRNEQQQLYSFLWLAHLERYLQHIYRSLTFPFYRSLLAEILEVSESEHKPVGGVILAAHARYQQALREMVCQQERRQLGQEQDEEPVKNVRSIAFAWPTWTMLWPDPLFPSVEQLRHDDESLFCWLAAAYRPGCYGGRVRFYFTRDVLKRDGAFWQRISAQHDKKHQIRTLAGTRETCKTVYARVLARYLRNNLDEASG